MSASASCRVWPLSSSTKARPGDAALGGDQQRLAERARHGSRRPSPGPRRGACSRRASWPRARRTGRAAGCRPTGRPRRAVSSTLAEPSSRLRAWSTVMACTNSLGLSPHQRLNSFWQCAGLRPRCCGQPLERGLLGPGLGQEGDGAADQLVVARAVGAERGGGVRWRWLCAAWVVLAVISGGDPDLGRPDARFDPFPVRSFSNSSRRRGRPAAPLAARTAKSRRSSSVRKRAKASSLPCDDDAAGPCARPAIRASSRAPSRGCSRTARAGPRGARGSR